MKDQSKVQGNIFALVQIFSAIPPPSLSAPAELRLLTPVTEPFAMLIRIPYLFYSRAQYILGVRQGRIPSKDDSGRLNLQCRSDISLHLYPNFIPCHFVTKP
jgi:hypothetical protein